MKRKTYLGLAFGSVLLTPIAASCQEGTFTTFPTVFGNDVVLGGSSLDNHGSAVLVLQNAYTTTE